MNSRQLQYAIVLSEALNFSQAAELLGISQPSLSKQILSLEGELGVRLFDRNHNPLSLTPAGEYFIRQAREQLYREDQMYRALERYRTGESGRLVIGVSPFRSMYLMPEIVKKIRDRYPGVCVTMREESSAQLKKEAAEGRYDFAIVNLPVDDSLLEVTLLEPETLVLAVPDAMLPLLPEPEKEQHPTISFVDACRLPFVVAGQNQEMRQLFDKLCAASGGQPVIAAEVVGISAALAMARAGVGAALLPLQFASSQPFDEGLTLFAIRDNAYSRQPVIVSRRGQYISEAAAYAMELLALPADRRNS